MSTRTNIAKWGCLPIAALIALVIALGGGEDDTNSDAKPKPTPSATTSASPKDDGHTPAETAFLLTTRAKIPALEDVPDEQILDLGHSSCTAIDAGNSPTAVAAEVEKGLQIGAENSAYIVGAAVSQFCPEHKSKI
ncbi:DUF732 domain-containing protein [Streptomyces werraensis]|uniref:DUF732 domain-containing protein n=1 Tax=Streptomyces werraensis TaxID=68284 RepID=UPI00380AC0E1